MQQEVRGFLQQEVRGYGVRGYICSRTPRNGVVEQEVKGQVKGPTFQIIYLGVFITYI